MHTAVNIRNYLVAATFGCSDPKRVRVHFALKQNLSSDSYPQKELHSMKQGNWGELQHQRGRTGPHPGKHNNTGPVHPAPQSTTRQAAGAVQFYELPPALLPRAQRNTLSDCISGIYLGNGKGYTTKRTYQT